MPKSDAPKADAEIAVRVTPRAGRSAVAGQRDGTWLVRLAAAPVEGAANAALIELLAGALDLPRRQLTLISGEKSRNKRVRIVGLDPPDVAARLKEALTKSGK